jgi:hypothetical protein
MKKLLHWFKPKPKLYIKHEKINLFIMACDEVSHCVEPLDSNLIPSTHQSGICHLCYDEKNNILHIHLKRPGILIGKGGRVINLLEKELGCKFQLHEVVLGHKTKLIWN